MFVFKFAVSYSESSQSFVFRFILSFILFDSKSVRLSYSVSGYEMEKMDKLEAPSAFPFPFTPYPIQHDFMTSLYQALEGGKLGIFESPTGTVSIL